MAVGAASGDIWRLVLRDVALLAGSGIVLGVPAALVAARLLDSLMFGVTAYDVSTLGGSALLLVAVAMLAAALPACHAVRVLPAITLRAE